MSQMTGKYTSFISCCCSHEHERHFVLSTMVPCLFQEVEGRWEQPNS